MDNDKYYYDITKIVCEIEECYKNKFYFAAVALSLILPDVCAKIEYGKNHGHKHIYIEWCKSWLSDYFVSYDYLIQTDELWANAIYQARCGILHDVEFEYKTQGNDFIDLKGFKFYINENVKSFRYDAASIEGETYSGACRKINRNNFKININVGYFIDMIINGVYKFIQYKNIKIEQFPILKVTNKNEK